jgi:hypothetical protein
MGITSKESSLLIEKVLLKHLLHGMGFKKERTGITVSQFVCKAGC